MQYPKILSNTSIPIVYDLTIELLANRVMTLDYQYVGNQYINPSIFNQPPIKPILLSIVFLLAVFNV